MDVCKHTASLVDVRMLEGDDKLKCTKRGVEWEAVGDIHPTALAAAQMSPVRLRSIQPVPSK